MTDLMLHPSEQAALRAVIASEPDRGTDLPGESVLDDVARLIPCDAVGIALLDAAGSTVEPVGTWRDPSMLGPPLPVSPLVGIHLIRRGAPRPRRSGPSGISVLSFGVRSSSELVVKLWMVRRTADFSDRDRALLSLVAPALERLMRERPRSAPLPSLTAAERRVLRQVAGGLSNAEIADRLSIAPCTVRKHLENAYRKLGVSNRMAAVVAIEGRRAPEDRTALLVEHA